MLVASKLNDSVEQFRCVDGFPSKSIAAVAYCYSFDKFPMDNGQHESSSGVLHFLYRNRVIELSSIAVSIFVGSEFIGLVEKSSCFGVSFVY